MKMRIASLLALLLLGATAPAAHSQSQQPILQVSMVEVEDLTTGAYFGQNWDSSPNPPSGSVNGGYGVYTDTIEIWGLASGTFPVAGFTYTFYVNGEVIGSAVNTPTTNNDTIAQSVGWTPPQPGTYFFSVTATDSSGHTATSRSPVEYFATGVSIVSPVPNTLTPLGSSVVIQAAAAINAGAVSRVEFLADGAVIGSSNNYPYSIIYTPPGPVSTVHFIRAQSYLADGVTVAASSPLQGIIVVAPVLPLPLCSIGSPTQTTPPTTIPIPNYVASASAFVPIIVNAGGANNITQVQLYINGVLFKTLTALPYTFQWQPTVAGHLQPDGARL